MFRSSNIKRGLLGRGQGLVEFSMIAVVAILILFLGIQFALLGQAALAVGQLAYQGARYASINPDLSSAAVTAWMQGEASPTIANKNSSLTISVTPDKPRTFQGTVTVTVTLDPVKQGLILLPNPFFGIRFGTKISSTQNAMVD